MEILAHLNMVDKVVKMDNLDKLDAHRKYGFDVVFIGDDWKNSPRWNKTEERISDDRSFRYLLTVYFRNIFDSNCK